MGATIEQVSTAQPVIKGMKQGGQRQILSKQNIHDISPEKRRVSKPYERGWTKNASKSTNGTRYFHGCYIQHPIPYYAIVQRLEGLL